MKVTKESSAKDSLIPLAANVTFTIDIELENAVFEARFRVGIDEIVCDDFRLVFLTQMIESMFGHHQVASHHQLLLLLLRDSQVNSTPYRRENSTHCNYD